MTLLKLQPSMMGLVQFFVRSFGRMGGKGEVSLLEFVSFVCGVFHSVFFSNSSL